MNGYLKILWFLFTISVGISAGGATLAIDPISTPSLLPPPNPVKIIKYGQEQAAIHGISWDIMYGIVNEETQWDMNRPPGDRGKSFGLCQIQVNTARSWGGLRNYSRRAVIVRLKNPHQNLKVCARTLRTLQDYFCGDELITAVAFNAGHVHGEYVANVTKRGCWRKGLSFGSLPFPSPAPQRN